MFAQDKIIKADTAKIMGKRIEKVELTERKFGTRVFKNVPVGENAVELEMPDQTELQAEEKKVELERFYDKGGNLTGVRITCKCGEVIELEFTQD
ncbi:MAG TPA: hypothetical protein VM123_17555 [archaeon]|nr:hypothetical protein [archaeon]